MGCKGPNPYSQSGFDVAAPPESASALGLATSSSSQREPGWEVPCSSGRVGTFGHRQRGGVPGAQQGWGRTLPVHLPHGTATLSSPSLDSAWRLWLQNKRYSLLTEARNQWQSCLPGWASPPRRLDLIVTSGQPYLHPFSPSRRLAVSTPQQRSYRQADPLQHQGHFPSPAGLASRPLVIVRGHRNAPPNPPNLHKETPPQTGPILSM